MSQADAYPTFSPDERIADTVMHILGVVFAFVAAAVLVRLSTASGDAVVPVALYVYGGALIASFVASACYHCTPWEGPRHTLRRIDHAAIYLKIAGTYTPLVVIISTPFAYGILALVWVLAILGALAKLFFWARASPWGMAPYAGLGWLGAALLTSLIPTVPSEALALILIGGLAYSVGAILFGLKGWRFQYAVWHAFVLVASICFFTAISWGVVAAHAAL